MKASDGVKMKMDIISCFRHIGKKIKERIMNNRRRIQGLRKMKSDISLKDGLCQVFEDSTCIHINKE